MTFTKFTSADGIQSNVLSAIGVSLDGTVWAGSEGCGQWGDNLSAYNGIQWKVFQDESGPGKSVSSLAFARDGAAWVGTNLAEYLCGPGRGLFRYRDKVWTRFTHEDGFGDVLDCVNSVAIDAAGIVWAGTNKGIGRYDGVSWRNYTKTDGLVSDSITAAAVDSLGRVWAGTYSGLSCFDGKTWKTYTLGDGLAGNYICSLSIGPGNEVWAGTETGLSCFDGAQWKSFRIADGLPDDAVNSIAVSPGGVVWIGTAKGLGRYDGVLWTRWTTNDGPRTNSVTAIAAGRDGKLWYGMDDYRESGGVGYFDGKTWDSPETLRELDQFAIGGIAADNNGNVWIGAFDRRAAIGDLRVFRYDGSVLTTCAASGDLAGKKVSALAIGPKNDLWVGTDQALHRFDGTVWKRCGKTDGMPESSINAIAFGPDGMVWAGTRDGLYCSQTGIWTRISTPEGMPVDIVGVAVDSGGAVFVIFGASNGNGFYRFKDDTWTPVNISAERIIPLQTVFVDSRDRLWAGTPSFGVFCFDGNSWKSYTVREGLGTNNIWKLAEGSNGEIWTAPCLSRFLSDTSTGIDRSPFTHRAFAVLGNHPNPFNMGTIIEFTLPAPGKSSLIIYDITGRKVRELVSGDLSSGKHSVLWDGKDSAGETVSSGIYLSTLRLGSATATRRMLFLK